MFGKLATLSDGTFFDPSEVAAVTTVNDNIGWFTADRKLYKAGFRTFILLRTGRLSVKADISEVREVMADRIFGEG